MKKRYQGDERRSKDTKSETQEAEKKTLMTICTNKGHLIFMDF